MKKLVGITGLMCLLVGWAMAQPWRGGRGGRGGGVYTEGGIPITDDIQNPRELASHSTGTPMWTNAPGFDADTFTFVRVRRERAPYSGGGNWATDTPDSDLNLSYRLQQMTSMKVNPDGLFIHLTDKDLANYPFIYMVEPGSLLLNDEEIVALRRYLLNGGFLMLDDFWGDSEWDNAEQVLKQVLPDKSFVEIGRAHV